jgi:hypothetical protein
VAPMSQRPTVEVTPKSFALSLLVLGGLASILYLLGPAVKFEYLKNLNLSKLRRMHQAIAIYQESHGVSVSEGSAADLRLPPHTFASDMKNLGLTRNDLLCECAMRLTPLPRDLTHTFTFHRWSENDVNLRLTPENVLFSTLACSPKPEAAFAPLVTHVALGVRLNGQLIYMRKKGDPTDERWWK